MPVVLPGEINAPFLNLLGAGNLGAHIDATGRVGIGAVPLANECDVGCLKDGILALKETATPTADATYGKVYTKNDNKLYFQDGAGVEHELGVTALVCPSFQFFADQLDNPDNADWAVNALAPVAQDTNDNGITVRLHDDTIEEGTGFQTFIPAGATNMRLTFISRAETAPPAARTLGLKLYERGLPAAVDAWNAGIQLTDLDFTTNENWLEDSQIDTLANWGLTAGQVHQFELTRVAPSGGVNLVGDWTLLLLKVDFT